MYANQAYSGWYKVQARAAAIGQVTQFAQPGTWRYIDSASCYIGGPCAPCNTTCPSDTNGTYATLRSISGSDWSVVAETINATTTQSETFCITPNEGLTSSGTVHGWLTNSTNNLHHDATLDYTLDSSHCFTASLAPNSLYTFTTTTGQAFGTTTPPAWTTT